MSLNCPVNTDRQWEDKYVCKGKREMEDIPHMANGAPCEYRC